MGNSTGCVVAATDEAQINTMVERIPSAISALPSVGREDSMRVRWCKDSVQRPAGDEQGDGGDLEATARPTPPDHSIAAPAVLTAPAEETEGQRFHKAFTLLGKVGCGTFSQVYAAHDSKGNLLAVKAVRLVEPGEEFEAPPSAKGNVPMHPRTFVKECDVLRRASHCPNCVDFVGAFYDGSLAFAVLELCDVGMWEFLKTFKPLGPSVLQKAFRQMTAAVAGIHDARIIHRDIKLDNFLCCWGREGLLPTTKNFTLKLCDFGLADILSANKSMKMRCVGTAPYMAPEVLNKEDYNEKADVWSLGVTCYTLLFGRFPYSGVDDSAESMKTAIRNGEDPVNFSPPKRDGVVSAYSLAGVPALRLMLERAADKRTSAAKLLKQPWLCKESVAQVAYCYRGELQEARRAGIFDTRNLAVGSGKSMPSALDEALIEAQRAVRGGSGRQLCATYARTSCSSSRSRDSSRQSSREGLGKASAPAFTTASTRDPADSVTLVF